MKKDPFHRRQLGRDVQADRCRCTQCGRRRSVTRWQGYWLSARDRSGHVFAVAYPEVANLNFIDEDGASKPMLMGTRSVTPAGRGDPANNDAKGIAGPTRWRRFVT
jgi:hypothetical protein